MKQFTVITKDGSKWLRPTDVLSDVFNVIYIGNHPEGTVLDESEVREVRQYRLRGTDHWFHPNDSEYKSHELDVLRTAYTDAEPQCPECGKYCSCPEEDLYDAVADYRNNHPEPSRDRQVSYDPRYPLFEHMSSEHGLTLLDSELDEISHHCKILTGAEYWENRALAAEKLIEMEPSDPKTYDEFCRLRDEWYELKNQEPK